MFDLLIAHIAQPDRERELALALDRRRLLKVSETTSATAPHREPRTSTARAAMRITSTER